MLSKDDVMTALSNLTAEQLQGILAQGNGRSPNKPRQLHDLRLQPTATDPRPLFIPSAEGSRDVPERHLPYPKLLWHVDSALEITVYDEAEHHAKLDGGEWTSVPPTSKPIDPVERARLMFEALNDEDKALVLEQQRQARIAAVSGAMSALTANQAAQAVGLEIPAKRGPGRPRKADVA